MGQYKYSDFFWSTDNNMSTSPEYCILIDNKIEGSFSCTDESVAWNTACSFADRFQEQLNLDDIDTHQEKNRSELKIEFIEIASAYYGLSTYKKLVHTLTVQPIVPLGTVGKPHMA